MNPFDDDPDFLAMLGRVAANKPANSDLYTGHLADFIETFTRVLGDPELPHLFFVEGGALAVENALKCAFDWKSRHNEANGRSPELGTKVLHLTRAFHGRSGYTLSLTNTDPVKTDRFPKFDWPRIEVPVIHLGDVEAAEERALAQARAAFERHPHDIACFIAEPIQGEGGDNHMRAEFLLAMQAALPRARRAVRPGRGADRAPGSPAPPGRTSSSAWRPDIVAFAKKVQVGGIMAGRRVDLVPDNVFQVSGRINSTWGGGLVDMVRSRRMLEIVERDGLIPRAGELGGELLTALLKVQARFPGLVENARGRGLMCAFDLPDPVERDRPGGLGSGRTRGCSSCRVASGRCGSARRSRSLPTSWERACPPSTGHWSPSGTCGCRPSGPGSRPGDRLSAGDLRTCQPGSRLSAARRGGSSWAARASQRPIAVTRESTPSLAYIRFTWFFTVFSLRNRCWAICPLERPVAISSMTSVSRLLKPVTTLGSASNGASSTLIRPPWQPTRSGRRNPRSYGVAIAASITRYIHFWWQADGWEKQNGRSRRAGRSSGVSDGT